MSTPAETRGPEPAAATPSPTVPAPEPTDHLVVTEHEITLGGRALAYTVTTGTIVLREESEKQGADAGIAEGEKARARVFFTAYTLRDAGDLSRRPVTFSFNGGPGSASVWLHLGALGPRRVVMGDAGSPLPPPYGLADNEWSLLDETDLVFIDPVSTGYSRAVTGEKAKTFHTFKKDIESVGDFIRLYTTRYRRWGSPKFLVGESYGTTRAAGLSGYLQDRHGMFLNGIMLVSSVLDFQTLEFLPTNDLPCIAYLPSYAATAWYHRRLAPELQADLAVTLREVEAFAFGEYAGALLQGSELPAESRTRIAAQVARYTGLTPGFVERADLRIELGRFTKELLRDTRRTVGRLDSRFIGIDRDSAGERPEGDPSMSAIMGPYTAAFNDYVRGELGYEVDLPYEVLSFPTNEAWSFGDHENKFVEVAETLRRAMTANPALRIFVANGYFDLATPYAATVHTFRHLGLDESLRGNVSMGWYEAGHMMYVHLPSLARLKQDLAAFIRGALAR
jgi:carboxypeptidase C (cathepsin A)